MTIYTIGHSTRTFEEFASLLGSHQVTQLADVRTAPRSRRHPHFSRELLSARLQQRGIAYRHFPALGGLRRPRPDSSNIGWRNESFRGYADHMQTDGFAEAVDELLQFGNEGRTAVMCAEAVWWRCHRGLLADALTIRDVAVRHILTNTPPQLHQLCDFARTDGRILTYTEDDRVPLRGHGNRNRTRTV